MWFYFPVLTPNPPKYTLHALPPANEVKDKNSEGLADKVWREPTVLLMGDFLGNLPSEAPKQSRCSPEGAGAPRNKARGQN